MNHTEENLKHISWVEDIMELGRCWFNSLFEITVEVQRGLRNHIRTVVVRGRIVLVNDLGEHRGVVPII